MKPARLPKLVGLVASKPGAGKDTFFKGLMELTGEALTNVKFAAKLEQEVFSHFLWKITKNDLKALRDIPGIKDHPLDMLACAKVEPTTEYSEWLLKTHWTYDEWYEPRSMRWHLIQYGTEFIRKHCKQDNYWLNAGLATAADAQGTAVITDVRFPNEALRIKEAGGFLIFLDSPWNTNENGGVADGLIKPEDCHMTIQNTYGDPLAAPRHFLNFLEKGPYRD